MRFVKPLDKDLVLQLADSHDYLVCAEENAVCGGTGSAVLEMLAAEGRLKPVLLIGIPDTVTDHGDPKLLLDQLGLSAERLAERIAAFAREAV